MTVDGHQWFQVTDIDPVKGVIHVKALLGEWNKWLYKRRATAGDYAWHINLSQTPLLKIRIEGTELRAGKPVTLQLVCEPNWSEFYYPDMILQAGINEFTVDLRQPSRPANGIPDLTNINQVCLILGGATSSQQFIRDEDYWLYGLDVSEAPPAPLSSKITPTTATAYPNDYVTVEAEGLYGTKPYTYLWHDGSIAKQNTLQYAQIGQYSVFCDVTDSLGATSRAEALIYVFPRPSISSALHTVGNKIVNAAGQTIKLLGVHAGGFGDTTSGGYDLNAAWDGYTTFREEVVQQLFKQLAQKGVNCIRFMINMDWWKRDFRGHINWTETQITETYDASFPSYKETIKRVLAIAQQHGIYVVVSVWTADWATTGQRLSLPFPSANFPDESAVTGFWLQIAGELQVHPNAIFEFYNEPAESSQFDAYYTMVKNTVIALRANGYDNLVLFMWGYCGGFNWSPAGSSPPWIEPPAYWINKAMEYMKTLPNIAISNHLYRYHGSFGNPPCDSDFITVANWLKISLGYELALDTGLPVVIGEVGDLEGTTEGLETFENSLRTFNEWGISYIGWGSFFQLPLDTFTPTAQGDILILAIAQAQPVEPAPPPPTPTPKPTYAARSVGPLGVPSALLRQLWRLRERFIRPEVHRKLHPLV